MAYTPEQGRAFWLAFDNHFKFEAGDNGLWDRYESWGGYGNCFQVWRDNLDTPAVFGDFVTENQDNLKFVAVEQEEFFNSHFNGDLDDMVAAFKDFAFGVLASPDDPNRGAEPVHTMNGGLFASDYASWHGYIEAVLVLEPGSGFWTALRWINGMAWELQIKARPQEIYPNNNTPLAQSITDAIHAKWAGRTAAEIAGDFSRYEEMPDVWLI